MSDDRASQDRGPTPANTDSAVEETPSEQTTTTEIPAPAEEPKRDERPRHDEEPPHDVQPKRGRHAAPEEPGDDAEPDPAAIARRLALAGDEGPVYGPLDFTIPGHGLTALIGRGGSGRTALALTLSGRMRAHDGELTVLGHDDPRAIRDHVAIAGVDQIDALDRNVRVRTVLKEHLAWATPWYRRTPAVDEDLLAELAGPVFGDRTLPPLDAHISEIDGVDRHLLRIALALHPARGDVRMLVVDDLDQVRELFDRFVLLGRLFAIAETMPVVVNTVNPLPERLLPAERQLPLDANSGHRIPDEHGLIPELAALLPDSPLPERPRR